MGADNFDQTLNEFKKRTPLAKRKEHALDVKALPESSQLTDRDAHELRHRHALAHRNPDERAKLIWLTWFSSHCPPAGHRRRRYDR